MRAVDPRLMRESRGARVHLVLTVLFGVGTAICVILQAVLLARIVSAGFFKSQSLAQLTPELLWLVAVAFLRGALAGGFELSGRIGAVRAMSELRLKLVDRLFSDLPAGLGRERTGELVGTLVQGVDLLEAYFSRYLPQVALAMLVPPVILAYILPIDLATAAVLAITVPLIPVFMILIGKMAAARTEARWQSLGRLSAHFLDVVRGLVTLRANNRAEAQIETIASVSDQYRRETMKTLRVAFLSALVLELLAMIGTALVAATVGVQLVNGDLQLEAGLTVLILAPEVYQPLRQLGAQFHASADGLAATERIFEVLDAEPGLTAEKQVTKQAVPNVAASSIEFDNVSYSYTDRPGEGVMNFDLTIAPGEFVALVGPNGSGKSTLVSLLMRFIDQTSGRIQCGGVDVRELDAADWRRQIAWVGQRPHLFAMSIADNVRIARPDASDAQLDAVVDQTGISGFVNTLPNGLETMIGEGGRSLSAGECQRIALARALLRDAPILLLDEPVAHLDRASVDSVGAAIAGAARGRTTLMIVHEPALAATADRIVTIAGGRIESGDIPTSNGATGRQASGDLDLGVAG